MPRRNEPDSLSLAVGERIRALRKEEDMTIEQLAQESATGSKGHLSNIERGLVRPNIYTLQQVADGLGVEPLDLLTFPKRSLRDRLIDLTRHVSRTLLTKLIQQVLLWIKSPSVAPKKKLATTTSAASATSSTSSSKKPKAKKKPSNRARGR